MNVEPPETLVIIESIVYKSNGFAISLPNHFYKRLSNARRAYSNFSIQDLESRKLAQEIIKL